MDKQQLKPCPFCGGEPELVDSRVEWFVRCNHCKPFATVIYGDNARHIDHCSDDAEGDAASAAVDWDALKQSAIHAWNRRSPPPPSASGEREARYRFLLALLIERGVLTDQRYRNGTWSLQGIYGVDDSGLRGAGRSPEEAIDNAIVMEGLQPNSAEWQEAWNTAHRCAAIANTSPGIDAAEQKPVGYLMPSGAFIHLEDSDERTTTNGRPMTFMDAAPPAAQPSAEWLAEAECLLDDYRDAIGGGTFAFRHGARAALLAHLKARP